MKKKQLTVREIALNIINKAEKQQSYTNLLVKNNLNKYKLSSRDAKLLTMLSYGTVQRKYTLDFYLQPFIKGNLQTWVRNLLRMTVYQLVYLDRIPVHAAINEAVEISKKRGHQGVAKLINGILRAFVRTELRSFDEIADQGERLAIETSHPLWLINLWINDYGYEKTELMCRGNLASPVQSARVNQTLITPKLCLQQLTEAGFQVELSNFVPEGIRNFSGNLANSECYQAGLITIQDESSMLVTYALDPQEGDKILDVCAAPGGKTTHLAERINNSGNIIALDIYEHKIKLINEQVNRLKLTNVTTKLLDGRQVASYFKNETFDRILLDVPCSGFGVIRRKPDLKYTKTKKDLLSLQQIQLQLLEQVTTLLKVGGLLVYSTCTVNRLENDNVIEQFLKLHDEFEIDKTMSDRLPGQVKHLLKNNTLQIFPQDLGTDGFFIACLRKKVNY